MSETLNALSEIQIEEWRPDLPYQPAQPDQPDRPERTEGGASLDQEIDMLGEVLRAVVHDGAGVSFVVPFSLADARAFWIEKVLPGVRARTRRVIVARWGARIVGTVQLDIATPPNQQHRGEVAKLLVHPDARRRGIARALMIALEAVAQSEGRTLLTLDTWTGGHAESLYRSLGYHAAGVIPRFARGSLTPDLEPTTIMYKELAPSDRRA
jgi:ribosomal protein S18 acetylase RimI-like enzyme